MGALLKRGCVARKRVRLKEECGSKRGCVAQGVCNSMGARLKMGALLKGCVAQGVCNSMGSRLKMGVARSVVLLWDEAYRDGNLPRMRFVGQNPRETVAKVLFA